MMVYLYRRTVSSSMSDLIHLNIQGLCVFLAQAKVLRCYSVHTNNQLLVFLTMFLREAISGQIGNASPVSTESR